MVPFKGSKCFLWMEAFPMNEDERSFVVLFLGESFLGVITKVKNRSEMEKR